MFMLWSYFFTVQFSMIWRLAKDHNFTQILTLSKYGHLKGPKLTMNNLKRPKYRDILSKLTKTIGREQEVVKPYFKLLCFIFDCSSLIEIERYVIHKKVSLTYFHFQGVLGQLLLGIVAKHCDLRIWFWYNQNINKICRQKKSQKDRFWHVLLQEQFVLFTSVKVNLE